MRARLQLFEVMGNEEGGAAEGMVIRLRLHIVSEWTAVSGGSTNDLRRPIRLNSTQLDYWPLVVLAINVWAAMFRSSRFVTDAASQTHTSFYCLYRVVCTKIFHGFLGSYIYPSVPAHSIPVPILSLQKLSVL